MTVYAQISEHEGGEAKKPAVIFVHGGPPRQMLPARAAAGGPVAIGVWGGSYGGYLTALALGKD